MKLDWNKIELQNLWIAALRSEKWPKGNGFMRMKEFEGSRMLYDAFGILCDLCEVTWKMDSQHIHCYGVQEVITIGGKEKKTLALYQPPDSIVKVVGLRDPLGRNIQPSLMSLSDDPRVSFTKIGDHIEQHREQLFR